MNTRNWVLKNTQSLAGKTVAITGATGGLGRAVCRYVLSLSGNLILLTRDGQKTEKLCSSLQQEFPNGRIESLMADLTDMRQVEEMCTGLEEKPVDFLILNAGAYCLPRGACATGYDTVFQINFISQYYIARRMLPVLSDRHGKIIATGSIAHSASKTDPRDMDFSNRASPELVYGNSKRYLMFSLMELIKENPDVQLAVAHPGITYTNITSHYSKSRLALIKYPMKLIFMHPNKAARGIVKGIFTSIPYLHWIGPKYAHIWGNPKVSPLKSCSATEQKRIYADAESIYRRISAELALKSTADSDQAAPTESGAKYSG